MLQQLGGHCPTKTAVALPCQNLGKAAATSHAGTSVAAVGIATMPTTVGIQSVRNQIGPPFDTAAMQLVVVVAGLAAHAQVLVVVAAMQQVVVAAPEQHAQIVVVVAAAMQLVVVAAPGTTNKAQLAVVVAAMHLVVVAAMQLVVVAAPGK